MASLLSTIQSPADLRTLTRDELIRLAQEVRERIISSVSASGGHLASNLGVVELTIALHTIFDFERDRLLWDVGHQCYVHKLLTGRQAGFDNLRKRGGVSGFPSTAESHYDLFDVGHAGTAIATAVGMARGDQVLGRDNRTVALVGDASIVNGVAFEGLNQAGTLKRQFLTILNDNSMGIAKTQGGLASHLARFRTSGLYEEVKKKVAGTLRQVPVVGSGMAEILEHVKEGLKATVSPHQIFEQLGFVYVGPVEGHDLGELITVLKFLKNVDHPVLLHVHTEKGRGCSFALKDPCTFHSPGKLNINGDSAEVVKSNRESWTGAFSKKLIDLMRRDPLVYALTAAMPDGTGLAQVQQVLPDRVLDCGIAESSTVDIAAGMAKSGLKPVVCIYSTFLQRAFDQVFQEVVLQKLPVTFCLDRAGLVGGDGAVHHGYLDISYLRGFQNMVVAAPADEAELALALDFANRLPQPVALRYPRDVVPDPLPSAPAFELGKASLLKEGPDGTLLAYGSTVADALQAAEVLEAEDIYVSVINARFAKPLDRDMVTQAITQGGPVLTIEDHSVAGGFGSAVLETANQLGLPTDNVIRLGHAVDAFYEHGSRAQQLAEAGIDVAAITEATRRAVQVDRDLLKSQARAPARRAVQPKA